MNLSILSGTWVLLCVFGFFYKKWFLLEDEHSPSVLQSFGDFLSVELRFLLHFHNPMSGQDKALEKSLDVTPKFSLEKEKELPNAFLYSENLERAGIHSKARVQLSDSTHFPCPKNSLGYRQGLHGSAECLRKGQDKRWETRGDWQCAQERKWRESEAVANTWEEKVAVGGYCCAPETK